MPAQLRPGSYVDSRSLPSPFPRLARSASKEAPINRHPGLHQSFRQRLEPGTLTRALARKFTGVDLQHDIPVESTRYCSFDNLPGVLVSLTGQKMLVLKGARTIRQMDMPQSWTPQINQSAGIHLGGCGVR